MNRVLIACEFSGTVRDEFSRLGWDAWSCDLLPTESEKTKKEGKHYQCDVMNIINDDWDLMIAHPPCTYLANVGVSHLKNNPDRWQKQFDALNFVYKLLNANIAYIAVENPIGAISHYIRKPDQIIQPYYFGDKEQKKTCLWLKNLPLLIHCSENNLFESKTHTDKPEPKYIGKNGRKIYFVDALSGGKGKERSETFPGIAKAMAEQWTKYIISDDKY